MVKFFISGGAGFIGSQLCEEIFSTFTKSQLIIYDKLTYAGNLNFLRKGRDYTYLPLTTCSLKKIKSKLNAIKKYKPLMFCINDGPNVIDQKRILTKNFLHEYFPDKSIYEK